MSSLLTILCAVLLVILFISPFESLKWWAGWVADDRPQQAPAPQSSNLQTQPAQYVVFLSGVGTAGTAVDAWEQSLIDRLQSGLPGATVLAGVFPFTVREDTLTEHRGGAWFWRWLVGRRDRGPGVVAHLIDWRNLAQVFVSMDPRYGPIYNKGIEEKLAAVLLERGYVVGAGVPITLIGYSGGAQVALGASLYLAHDVQTRVAVISLGGVLGDDPALTTVEHLHHLWSTGDIEARLAMLVVPARWPISKKSRWNQAIAAQRVSQQCLGAMSHAGPKGYLDMNTRASDGRSYLEITATAMLDILNVSSTHVPEASTASVTAPASTP